MELTEAAVVEFVRWWCHLSTADGRSLVAADFEFDSGLEIIGREDFLAAWQYTGPFEQLRIVEVWVFGDRATVLFEGTDSVTAMRHRCCWMVAFDGLCARKLLACAAHVPADAEKPAWGRDATESPNRIA